MNPIRYERRRYTTGQTPIEKLERLSQALGGPTISIKRDDQLGLTVGGNKTRKLEYLVADALKQGADTLITCGAVQSNHCRLTLAAAVRDGLKCQLVLTEPATGYEPQASGNHLLFHLLGAEKIEVIPADGDMQPVMEKLAQELASEGRKAYLIPVGGSNEIGTLGYMACAEEIEQQAWETGTPYDYVVTASGSAGTQAGLVAGFLARHSSTQVIGVNVSRDRTTQEAKVLDLLRSTAEMIGLQSEIGAELISCEDRYVGPGYAIPTEEMVEAVKLVAQTEGILLDPVYTGKAMAGLIGMIREGRFAKEDHVLFLHTGGSPALYTVPELFIPKES
ncbi:cytochrome C biogenesis protein CcmE [Brevibacillus choshinensis]|uniref:Cytochrome C biogenesis protein CcmE n=1 Tax=Brevibacillus choshinensis TaxID=54911 RepID=A0ABR5N603_BRECH|nr:D-cysteine desulfhydrase [Brevibacillus choshinensis]KQL46044.1 cytochrome C biogenesis protein CcmE [Brevibacillus choshinensis]